MFKTLFVFNFIRNLRVFLADDLSFEIYIFSVVKKSRHLCNLLLFAFYNGLNNKLIISLYKVSARSLLNYASLIYSPYHM